MMMIAELFLIGIGTGNPGHVTHQAISQLKAADIILIPRKGSEKSDLADLRHQICDELLGADTPPILEFDLPIRDPARPYLSAVDAWHEAIADIWQDTIKTAKTVIGTAPRTAALLVWGDPSLYDSSMRIARRLKPAPAITIIPGITAIQALTAAHKIPINDLGSPFMISTGRQLRANGFPKEADTLVIMLDGECSFQTLVAADFDIWWGAYLGMENELILSGYLPELADIIVQTRKTARQKHGWIMDTYLLRRRDV